MRTRDPDAIIRDLTDQKVKEQKEEKTRNYVTQIVTMQHYFMEEHNQLKDLQLMQIQGDFNVRTSP
ncbi:hypothetical protein NKOR_02345 [Candidatus Nitrosopumilus koreensis AR1]|uniref:Uncharacterized protein n=1 Tax=Candidatus Nitrosopumilus koreensis AR1 TaxID=1229908 RepID=K0B5K9_9ARCH|nr:hypothetical protein NKOR_02345 [Candidatus Nitrosopumilus koreensis AR1]